jgi:hypothetical protein
MYWEEDLIVRRQGIVQACPGIAKSVVEIEQRLAGASTQQTDVAVEQLESLLAPAAENLEERYERFFQQSGLFIERLSEEKQPSQTVSETRLKELAAKLGAAGPLSEVIVEERGRN